MNRCRDVLVIIILSWVLSACGGGSGSSSSGGQSSFSSMPPSQGSSSSTHSSSNQYTVTITPGVGGSVGLLEAVVSDGETLDIPIEPEPGYAIKLATGCNGELSGHVYSTSPIHSDCTINIIFDVAVPDSPQEITISAGNEFISISWPLIDKADGYNIYFSTETGVSPENYINQSEGGWERYVKPPHAITGLINDTDYYVVVTAYNSGGESMPSEQVSERPNSELLKLKHSGKLNDTGMLTCKGEGGSGLLCPSEGYFNQDGDQGRDAAAKYGLLEKNGSGQGGFDFTKLDVDGKELQAESSSWSCVKDNHTGLVWEVKSLDDGLREKEYTYTWYNPDSNANGGDPGVAKGGICEGIECGPGSYMPPSCEGVDCDTQSFIDAVNGIALCGFDDWRLPKRVELDSIINIGVSGVKIDSDYFPNTSSSAYWTSTPDAWREVNAWQIWFSNGVINWEYKGSLAAIRLVRSAN